MVRADDGDLLGVRVVRVVRAARQAGGPGVGAAEARRARSAAVSFAPSAQVPNIRHYRNRPDDANKRDALPDTNFV